GSKRGATDGVGWGRLDRGETETLESTARGERRSSQTKGEITLQEWQIAFSISLANTISYES
ncbi:hypothetical protein A2U01_0108531, partial [Trifolium medium]|nr:hypothetical protein [Trifolium medium]